MNFAFGKIIHVIYKNHNWLTFFSLCRTFKMGLTKKTTAGKLQYFQVDIVQFIRSIKGIIY